MYFLKALNVFIIIRLSVFIIIRLSDLKQRIRLTARSIIAGYSRPPVGL